MNSMNSWPKPTAELVETAVARFAVATQYRYFLDRLENPEWIDPLADHGFFCRPPEPIRSGSEVRFPAWPESRYLRRMAIYRPERVAELLRAIETENIAVLRDVAEAALEMPAGSAATLVGLLVDVADRPHKPHDYGGMMTRLALKLGEAGKRAAALRLVEVLLAVQPDPRGVGDRETTAFWYEPVFRSLDHWLEHDFFEEALPRLRVMTPGPVLKLAVKALEEYIELLGRVRGGFDPPDDESCFWRRAVEDHEQNRDDQTADRLVTAVRDAAKEVVVASPEGIPAVVAGLENRRWCLFHRIALHLVDECCDGSETLLVERLASRKFFDNRHLHHEYYRLLENHFAQLSEQFQRRILSWIEAGPKLPDYRAPHGHDEPEELGKSHAATWRLRWLHPIRHYLPVETKPMYDQLRQEYGEPEHPDCLVYFSSVNSFGEGPSPIAPDELAAMSNGEIVDFMSRGELDQDEWRLGVRESLSGTLQEVARSQPHRFSAGAMDFRDLDPRGQSALLHGLHDSAGDERTTLSWGPALELCSSILAEGRIVDEMRDGTRGRPSAESAVAQLVRRGLTAGPNEMLLTCRESVWSLITLLLESADPNLEDHELPAWTQVHSSGRGRGIELAVLYALWVRRRLAEEQGDGSPSTFAAMPEVVRALEFQLKRKTESSAVLWFLYGEYVPWLCSLDRGWVETNLSLIFPPEHDLRRRMAWLGYITMRRPYNDVLDILRAVYKWAVGEMGTFQKDDESRDPDKRLAEHLMEFCWRGEVGWDEEDQCLEEFFESAPDEVREHAMSFIGWSLRRTEGEIPVTYIENLKRLWSRRYDAGRSATDKERFGLELRAFASWLVSGKLDDAWALEQLRLALEAVGIGEGRTHGLWLTLEKLVVEHPLGVMLIVELALAPRSDVEAAPNVSVLYAGGSIVRILKGALRSGHIEAKTVARRTAESLANQHHFDRILGSEFRQHVNELSAGSQ